MAAKIGIIWTAFKDTGFFVVNQVIMDSWGVSSLALTRPPIGPPIVGELG